MRLLQKVTSEASTGVLVEAEQKRLEAMLKNKQGMNDLVLLVTNH